MADKYEYWRELFGEEFPESAKNNNADDISESVSESANDANTVQKNKVRSNDEHSSDQTYLNVMEAIYGIKTVESETNSEKWAYFGGGAPKDEPDIWFDAPGYNKITINHAEPPKNVNGLDSTHVLPDNVKQVSAESQNVVRAKAPVEEPTKLVGRLDEAVGDVKAEVKRDKFVVRGRRKRFGCLGGLMYFVFIVGISIILAMLLWLGACDVLALKKDDTTAVITVEKDFKVSDVSKQLADAGIIKYEFLFNIFAKFSHAQDKIDPGTYELSSQYDYRALIVKMQAGAGSQLTTSVTIPEGYTLKQTFELLESKNVCDYSELEEIAKNYPFKHEFLQEIPLGDATRLEGYLFPDTYEFFIDDDPVGVINKMLNNFDNRVTDEMREVVEESGMSLHDIVIIASLIEKEAANDDERPNIASVIYNRLNNWDNPLLQIDATVQYALPERKENLSYDDLEIDSPYNTYKYAGLPAGPIANPGLASIKAAIEPASTNYYYYLLSKDNKHVFFNSYDAFQDFKNSSEFGG